MNGPATAEQNSGPASTSTPNTQLFYAAPVSTGVTSTYLGVVITDSFTDDFDPGHGFPKGIRYLDINAPSNDVILNGLLAGSTGQRVTLRNIGETYAVLLNGLDNHAEYENQFTENAALQPGQSLDLVYYDSSYKWTVEHARID